MCLDLEAERALLARGFQTTLEQLEPDLRPAIGRLPQRFGKAAPATTLADCFTDLTLLYPVLIGEGLLPSSVQQARSVLVAHVLLAVFAFLDDRRRDGQIAIESVDARLAGWMVGEACRQLNLAIGSTGNHAIQVLLPIYAEAQGVRASDPGQLPGLIVRRHLPGIVTAMSLLEANHCESTLIDRVSAGYRHLVLSLQWIDDLRDLEDDLATGADNLLLCRVPKHIRGKGSLPDVIACVHAMGLFVIAVKEALTHVAAAREIAALLECHTLARLLEGRQQWLTDRDRQAARSPFVRSPGL